MRVFVFESITGGGMFCALPSAQPHDSLLAEGRAMLHAVASDFAQLNDTEVVCLWDQRLPQLDLSQIEFVTVSSAADEARCFEQLAASSDYTLLIAPELNGELLARTQRVERLGGRLLSPDSEFVRLTASKSKTMGHLADLGVRVPPTVLYDAQDSEHTDFPPPLIVKPDDGAGSIGIRWLDQAFDNETLNRSERESALCVQPYCPGRPASVAVLCSRDRSALFPACWQHLEPPRFEYAGGSIIQDLHLRTRAAKLAKDVVDALPMTKGLIGVDMVLGDPPDGSADVAIEVNPRLTTSYVGLRCLADQNLALAMLDAANGEEVSLSFRSDRIEFSVSGDVHRW